MNINREIHELSPLAIVGVCNKLVFHHIPKTAGTSLHADLINFFPQNKVCPERFDNLHRMTYEDLNNYDFFSGHFDLYQIGLIPSPKRVFTFLREPKKRIISLYYYWRSLPLDWIDSNNAYGPRLAKSMSFLEFLRSDDLIVRMNIENSMARSFLGRAAADNFSKYRGYDNEYYANTAFMNLQRYTFVGFVEHYEEDVRCLRKMLGIDSKYSIKHMNKTPNIDISKESKEIDKKEKNYFVEEELEKLTSIDTIFYNKALSNRKDLSCIYHL